MIFSGLHMHCCPLGMQAELILQAVSCIYLCLGLHGQKCHCVVADKYSTLPVPIIIFPNLS